MSGIFDQIWQWIVQFFQAVWAFLKDVYEWILHHIIAQIVAVLETAWNILSAILYPVIKFLKKIQAWYQKYIFPWQRLAIEIITRIRVALELFKLAGAKWAQKLDQDLAIIEGYVVQSIADITVPLNSMLTTLGLAINPTGILNLPFWTQTAFSNPLVIKQVASLGDNRPLTTDEQNTITQNQQMANGQIAVGTISSNGTLTYTPPFAALNAAADQSAQEWLQ